MKMLLAILGALLSYRRHRHEFTTMAEPPACVHCGRTGWAA